MGSNTWAYAVRRIVAGIPVVAVVLFITFSLTYLTPGDAATYLAGEDATPEQVQDVRTTLGLDRPFIEQFIIWAGSALTGHLGESLVLPQSVTEALLARAEPTIILAIFAQGIATIFAVPFGVIAAKYRGGHFDRAVNFGAVAGIAIPPFVVGIALILVFSVMMTVFPATGYVSLGTGLGATLESLILPAFALGLAQAAFIVRITRTSMISVFESDYVRAAMARGFSGVRVVFRHVLRPGIGPTISAMGLSFATLINGAIVVEIVFNIPGLGRLLTDSVQARDVPTLQGLLLAITVSYILINIITDVIQAAINPRIAL